MPETTPSGRTGCRRTATSRSAIYRHAILHHNWRIDIEPVTPGQDEQYSPCDPEQRPIEEPFHGDHLLNAKATTTTSQFSPPTSPLIPQPYRRKMSGSTNLFSQRSSGWMYSILVLAEALNRARRISGSPPLLAFASVEAAIRKTVQLIVDSRNMVSQVTLPLV